MSSYLFALVDGGGTVPPELGAARRLVARGHRVQVLAEDSMRDEVVGTGAVFLPWVRGVNRPDRAPEHDVLRDWECRTPLQLFKRMLDTVLAGPAPGYAADLLVAVDGQRPDIVVCSFFSVGAMVAAEAAGLLLTSPAFDFPAEMPDNVCYVGPVLDDPQWAVADTGVPPPGDGPVVLVAMSTTPQDQVDCLQRVVDALSALPVRGIVTAGPAVDPKALRPSRNVAMVESAPHSEVLKCTDVVVTHGGHGTVIRSLAAGVPLVVMPQGRDQADNAARVESRGAGVTIESNASPATIGAAVKRVLEDPSYGQAAKRLGDSIRADAASDMLVRELER